MVAQDDPRLRGRVSGQVTEPNPVPRRRVGPPRYKRAIVIWIALYPAVVAALSMLRPVIGEWPIPLQALVLTTIIIPTAVWVLIPIVERCLRTWLEPAADG